MKQKYTLKCGLAMAVCLAVAANGMCEAPWLEGFTSRQLLTVTNLAPITENLADFPLPVRLHAGNFDFRHANTDGLGIRFTADDGVTPLSFERERHDSATQQAEYWVRLPQLASDGPTKFYLYATQAPLADAAPGRKLYLNGELDNTLNDAGYPYGNWHTERVIGGWQMNAVLDEVRLSRVVRSPAWLRAQNAAIRDRLLAYGAAQTRQFWLEGYRYRRRIAITNTAAIRGTLGDFPVLVKLTDANFNFFKSSPGGTDIRFTMSDGVTPLSFERERHSRDTRQAEYWVRIPRLHAGTADTFYLYHSPEELPDASDPASVWDSNYLFVHHMAATGGATRVYDSTANAMTGTAANVTLGVEGFISGGVLTDGIAGHWISLANAFSAPRPTRSR
jgi:hypothetical protein